MSGWNDLEWFYHKIGMTMCPVTLELLIVALTSIEFGVIHFLRKRWNPWLSPFYFCFQVFRMCEPEAVRIPTTNYGTTVREIFHENKNREALIQCIASMLHLLSQLVHITIQSYAKLLLFNENVTFDQTMPFTFYNVQTTYWTFIRKK